MAEMAKDGKGALSGEEMLLHCRADAPARFARTHCTLLPQRHREGRKRESVKNLWIHRQPRDNFALLRNAGVMGLPWGVHFRHVNFYRRALAFHLGDLGCSTMRLVTSHVLRALLHGQASILSTSQNT